MANHCKYITDTFTVEDNDKVYDFNRCIDYIEYHGKAQYGKSFKINQDDCPTFYKLLIYMIKDQNEAQKLQIDLSKGILLSGPIGCGKTSIMHLIRPFSFQASDYKIKTCREVAFEFAKHGYIQKRLTTNPDYPVIVSMTSDDQRPKRGAKTPN